jgi:hypothetical protein
MVALQPYMQKGVPRRVYAAGSLDHRPARRRWCANKPAALNRRLTLTNLELNQRWSAQWHVRRRTGGKAVTCRDDAGTAAWKANFTLE